MALESNIRTRSAVSITLICMQWELQFQLSKSVVARIEKAVRFCDFSLQRKQTTDENRCGCIGRQRYKKTNFSYFLLLNITAVKLDKKLFINKEEALLY